MIRRSNIITKEEVEIIGYLKQGLSRDQLAKALNVKIKDAYYKVCFLRKKTNSLTDRAVIYKYENKEIYEISP